MAHRARPAEDRGSLVSALFVKFETHDGRKIAVNPEHVVYVAQPDYEALKALVPSVGYAMMENEVGRLMTKHVLLVTRPGGTFLVAGTYDDVIGTLQPTERNLDYFLCQNADCPEAGRPTPLYDQQSRTCRKCMGPMLPAVTEAEHHP